MSKNITHIGEYAFDGCCNFKKIKLPDTLTSIEDGTFRDCKSLTSITIPSRIKRIGNESFRWCNNLKNLTISKGVQQICKSAFGECIKLSTITIPNSVKKIKKWAFYGCEKIKDIYYTGSKANWKKIKISSGNNYLKSAKIHYNCPYPTSINKLTGNKKRFDITWEKANGANGYQIQCATNSKFTKNNNTITIKSSKTVSKTVKKLKAKKKYYVRIRAYKKFSGKKQYSSWSAKKTVTTK